MTPKELVDKITLAAEQLESLRTEHDLPVQVKFGDGEFELSTSNKKHTISISIYDAGMYYARNSGGGWYTYNTYEELVEDIKNR